MNRRVRLILVLLICASVTGVVYKVAQTMWTHRAMEIMQNPSGLLEIVPEAILRVEDFRHSKVEEGRKILEVTGDEAVYLKDEKEAVIKAPRLVFYHENGNPVEVRGDQGRLFMVEREIEKLQLRGDVEVRYQDFVLQTDEIVYFQKAEEVVSKSEVDVVGTGIHLQGKGARISLKENTIDIRGEVKTRIEPDLLAKTRLRAVKGG